MRTASTPRPCSQCETTAGAAETLITIAADHIHLQNVVSNTVNRTDFIL
jgi:hypothetical protein